MTLTNDLQFQSLRAMVVTHTHAKDRSVRKIVDRDGRTDGRTEATALPPVLTRSVNREKSIKQSKWSLVDAYMKLVYQVDFSYVYS